MNSIEYQNSMMIRFVEEIRFYPYAAIDKELNFIRTRTVIGLFHPKNMCSPNDGDDPSICYY